MGVSTTAPAARTASAAHSTPAGKFRLLRAPAAEPPLTGLTPGASDPSHPGLATAPAPLTVGPSVPVPTHPDGPVGGDAHLHARRFVLTTLRPMFEVLDRRRPAKHLTAIATGTVVDVLRSLADTAPAPPLGSTWRRVHIAQPRPVPGAPQRAREPDRLGVEVFLTYTRGDRVLAAAGRIESGGGRWWWTAFTTVV
ncbi:Rv3235 family protein [Tsukamurella soli]